MSDGESIEIRRQQRRGFLVRLTVAAVPVLCQVLMLLALWAAPEAFPAADRTFTQVRFWPIQVVLFCVSVAGTAIVNCVKLLLAEREVDATVVVFFLPLLLCLFVESMMFSATLLASGIGWSWLAGMMVVGGLTLLFAFVLEMELTGKA